MLTTVLHHSLLTTLCFKREMFPFLLDVGFRDFLRHVSCFIIYPIFSVGDKSGERSMQIHPYEYV